MSAKPDSCALCPRLCRNKCPVAVATGLESTTPTAIMTTLLLHKHEPYPHLNRAIDLCTRCRKCEAACGIEQPVVALLDEARTTHQPKPEPWEVPNIEGTGTHVAIISGDEDWSGKVRSHLSIDCAKMVTTDHLGELHCIRNDTKNDVYEKLRQAVGTRTAIVSSHTCFETLRAAGCTVVHLSHLLNQTQRQPRWRTCGCEPGPGISTLVECCGGKAPLSTSHPQISKAIAQDLQRRFQGQAIYIEDSRCSAHLREAGAQVYDPIDYLMSMEISNAHR